MTKSWWKNAAAAAHAYRPRQAPSYGVAYITQTEAAYAEQVNQRLQKQLERRAKELGFEVKKIETPVVE